MKVKREGSERCRSESFALLGSVQEGIRYCCDYGLILRVAALAANDVRRFTFDVSRFVTSSPAS